MSMKYLGETFDIHTSSRDLLFPHHENEMAIARALTGKPLANYWLHCERVEPKEPAQEAEKEPLPTLPELFGEGFTPREIRFWLLSGHYRKPLSFERGRLVQARQTLQRLDACVHALLSEPSGSHYPEIDQLVYDIRQGFVHAMDEDLNTPHAMAAVFKAIRQINRLLDDRQISSGDARKLVAVFRDIDTVLKIFDFSPPAPDPEVARLVERRRSARRAGNFEEADRIREELLKRGVAVHDEKIERSE
jgi:cysteinyl-tRNA synthetase